MSLLQKSVAKADFDRGSNHASSQEPPFKTYKTSRAAASSFPSDNSRHFGVNSSDSGPTSDFSRSNANATYPVRSSSRSWNHVNRSFPNGREKTLSSRSSSSSSRSNSSSTTPKASQEDIIRHNMTKLIEPKMLSDLDYGLIHYENGLIDEGAEVRMREVWRLEAQKDNQVKQDVDNGGPFSTIFRYLEQRGDSVAYVERQGEATPSYASVITEWRDDRIFALEKVIHGEACIFPYLLCLYFYLPLTTYASYPEQLLTNDLSGQYCRLRKAS